MFIGLDEVFGILLVLLLIGVGVFMLSLFAGRRRREFPPMSMPPQQGYGPPHYGTPYYGPNYSEPGYPPAYGRPPYNPNYPQPGYPQQGGVSPWVAGGLGALGGGLMGYGLGQTMAEHEQAPADGMFTNGEQLPADEQGSYLDYGGGSADFGGGDFGSAGDVGGGEDFGGDFGSEM